MKLLHFLLLIFTLTILSINIEQISNNEIILVNENNDVKQKSDKFDINSEVFVPTNEWQVVKPGQAIPKGLHVRINLQTGEREAKLLSNQENNEQSQITNQKISKQLEENLKDLNNKPQIDFDNESLDQKLKNIPKKLRNIDELKKEMNELNLNVQTDYELLKNLIQKLNQTDLNKQDKLSIIKELEYLVHQYDNGLLLCDLGGFDLLLNDFNKTFDEDLDIKSEIILVLGSAIQSNPKVKVFAIKTDLLQIILNRLSINNNNYKNEMRSKLIFALSALLRNFPFAQTKFLNLGGVDIMDNLLSTNSNSIKLKSKILTLADDLIKEKSEILSSNLNDETYEQYKEMNLIEQLMEKNWCEKLGNFLDIADDYDTKEKILNSILTMINKCKFIFNKNENLIKRLNEMSVSFKSLIDSNDSDDYFSRLDLMISQILNNFSNNNVNREDL